MAESTAKKSKSAPKKPVPKIVKSKTTTKANTSSNKSITEQLKLSSKKRSAIMNVKRWLALSLVVNILLGVYVLTTLSDPVKYSDATSGFTISIPAGWVRDDALEAFREIKGSSKSPTAEIYAYGQRNTTTGFYTLEESERNVTLDQVTEQINSGSNVFVLGTIGLSDAKYEASRGQQSDGSDLIRSNFTAKDANGDDVKGQHLLVVAKSGGAYSVVAFAKADAWDNLSADITKVMDTFYAP